jgi:iron-sulfur cluster assembly protein
MVSLTKQAADEIRRVVQEQKIPGEAALRIGVAEKGCSGHGTSKSYYLQLEEAQTQPDDQIFESEGVKILVDSQSLPYLKGLHLDFIEEIDRRGFVFFNPNARGSCDCGHSFNVDDDL